MAIVLNEIEWAEEALKNRDLGKKPYETISRIARYYLHNGVAKGCVKDELKSFVLSCDPKFPIHKWDSAFEKIIKYASKRGAVIVDGVGITSKELEVIKSLDGKQAKRLAFTLLCVAKYNILVNPNSDYWVSTADNEVFKMANISASTRRQCILFKQLKDSGAIQFSKKIDNLSVRVLFVDEDTTSNYQLVVTDFRNLGYQYLKFCGEPYFECEHCGIVTKRNNPGVGRKQKYCNSCAVEMKIKYKVNEVTKRNLDIDCCV